MSFTADFTAVQQSSLSVLRITDTSSGGTDPNLTGRKIYLYKIDNTTLVPTGTLTDYIDFPIVSGIGDTIDIDVLSRDYSLTAYVAWTSSSPIVGATYNKTKTFTAVGNTNLAAYEILQTISASPSILNDKDFRTNLFILYGEIDNANQAQTYGNQFAAQSALDRAYQMITNKSLYF